MVRGTGFLTIGWAKDLDCTSLPGKATLLTAYENITPLNFFKH